MDEMGWWVGGCRHLTCNGMHRWVCTGRYLHGLGEDERAAGACVEQTVGPHALFAQAQAHDGLAVDAGLGVSVVEDFTWLGREVPHLPEVLHGGKLRHLCGEVQGSGLVAEREGKRWGEGGGGGVCRAT